MQSLFLTTFEISKVIHFCRSKNFLGYRIVVYDFWGVGGDVWRWLCRHVCRKNSASVDGGPCGGSRVRRPGSEDPHQREQNVLFVASSLCFASTSFLAKNWILILYAISHLIYYVWQLLDLLKQSFCSWRTLRDSPLQGATNPPKGSVILSCDAITQTWYQVSHRRDTMKLTNKNCKIET